MIDSENHNAKAGATLPAALRHGVLLTACLGGLWCLLLAPAWWLGGWAGLEGLSIAALLCLIPGWLVFLFGSGYGLAGLQVAVVVRGMALRMLFVLGGTLLILTTRRHLGVRDFVVWLLVFYLAALAVETGILLKGRAPSA